MSPLPSTVSFGMVAPFRACAVNTPLIVERLLPQRIAAGIIGGIPDHIRTGADFMNPAAYQSYCGLPTLAGLATIAEASRPGLSVEACVARLKRYHYAFLRLHDVLTARITAEPIYELKTAFSHHAYLCSEHVLALRTRVGEMREPPLGLAEVPHPALEAFFHEILAAPSTATLLVAIYENALQSLDAALA